MKNPLFSWISKSVMVLSFSEKNLDFPKMLSTQGFWLPKGVPFLEFFAGPYFRCLKILRESCKSLDFLYFANIPGIFIIFLGFSM